MKGFYDKIVALCAGRGITVKELERILGYANSYFAHTDQRGSVPSYKRMDEIADYFGVTKAYLTGDEENAYKAEAVRIPLLGRVAAGMPISAVQNVIGQEEITAAMARQGEYFALKIKGDSMTPYILDGDVVICRQQEDADTGDIVIALINGDDGVCKKLKKTESGIMLISNNPSYDPLLFSKQDIASKPVEILGKVVEIRRSI